MHAFLARAALQRAVAESTAREALERAARETAYQLEHAAAEFLARAALERAALERAAAADAARILHDPVDAREYHERRSMAEEDRDYWIHESQEQYSMEGEDYDASPPAPLGVQLRICPDSHWQEREEDREFSA